MSARHAALTDRHPSSKFSSITQQRTFFPKSRWKNILVKQNVTNTSSESRVEINEDAILMTWPCRRASEQNSWDWGTSGIPASTKCSRDYILHRFLPLHLSELSWNKQTNQGRADTRNRRWARRQLGGVSVTIRFCLPNHHLTESSQNS